METKDKRHQVEEREQLTEDQRYYLAQKSDDRCVWCGRKVFYGYGGTVDHYVPLKKGGTNDFVNLVLMCKECNLKKGSKIVPTSIAATYLNEGPKVELDAYFDNYIKNFDYISRGNLMACDMYLLYLLPEEMCEATHRAKKKGKKLELLRKQPRYILTRAYPDDLEKISAYYIKYLKKNKLLDDETAAVENIKFWMRFGAIYYVEKGNEIAVMSTVLMNKHSFMSINVFPYYSNLLAQTLSRGIVTCLGEAVTQENDLPYLKISVNMVQNDSLTFKVIRPTDFYLCDSRLMCVPFTLYNDKYVETDENGDAKVARFFSRFYDIEDSVQLYLYENDLMSISWMANEITGRDFEKAFAEYQS